MKSKGLEVIVVSSEGEALDRVVERDEIEVYAVPIARGFSLISDLSTLVRLWRLFRKLKPTIVHASTGKAGPLGMMSAALAGVPIRIYSLRGLMMDRREGAMRHFVKILEWIACRSAHRVLAVSKSVVDVMISCRLCPPDKITVPANGSSNGVDAEGRFNPYSIGSSSRAEFRARHNLPEDGLVIGFIGRLVKGKGIMELAEAWNQIRERYDKTFLIIVGSPEYQDPVPEGILTELYQDERARILELVPNNEMPAVYAGLDLIAFPTYSEGLPNVVLEAGSMELPVVASRVSGCVDAIIDGSTGFLICPKDAESLAVGLQTYLDSEELRQRHGKAARRYVLEHFQPEKVWQSIYSEYERLLTIRGFKVVQTHNDTHETIADIV